MLIQMVIFLSSLCLIVDLQISNLGSLLEGIADENISETTEISYTTINTDIVHMTSSSEHIVHTVTESTSETELPKGSITISTTCINNETFCTTVAVPTSTGINKIDTSFGNKSVIPEETIHKHDILEFNSDLCTCNLQRQYCDINCCCDEDCNFNDKIVFKNCQPQENLYRDTSFCQYMDYIYINNTPYVKEINQNGFFCIAQTNLPSSYVVQNEQPIKTLEDAALQIQKLFWQNLDTNITAVQHNLSRKYVSGASIWIIKNNQIEEFTLPDNLLTDACVADKKQKYLENYQSKCAQSLISPYLVVEEYQNIFFIGAPHLFNLSLYATNLKECPKNICLPVNVKLCNHDNNCNMSLNSTLFAKEIKYNFYHNGTQGFTKIDLFIILDKISTPMEQKLEIWQKYEVNYFWFNYVVNYSNILSGNPGYLLGKPILIRNYKTFISTTKNKTVSQDTIIQNPINVLENFLHLPESKGGHCVLNNFTHLLVKFGYNIIVKCKIKEYITVRNITCNELQKAIFNYWPISHNYTNINRLVGIFGNANESILTEWVKIISNKSPAQILNDTIGSFTNDGKILRCRNILTTLKIDIFHAKTNLKKLINQQKVIAATFQFTSPKEFEINLLNNSTVLFETNIRAEVVFYDVTAQHIKKYVDPPTFRISLPYDFFYPFIKVHNFASCSNCHNLLIFSCIPLFVINNLYSSF